MKRFLAYILLVIFLTGCSLGEKKSPVEGGWKLVYANNPSVDFNYPENITGSAVKFWTSGTFAFTGHFKTDTATIINYGWGTYKLTEGNRYEESIMYHHLMEASIGNTIKMILEVKNDTLYQIWPVDENWQPSEKHNIEKFVRLNK